MPSYEAHLVSLQSCS